MYYTIPVKLVKQKFLKFFCRIKGKVTQAGHFFRNFRIILPTPGGEGNGYACLVCHFISGLHIIHYQQLGGRKMVLCHDLFQSVGTGLSQMLRKIPAVNGIRFDGKMGSVIPKNVGITGMRDYADKTALRFLPTDNSFYTGKRSRNVSFDKFLPAPIFINKLLLGKMIPFPAHIRKAQMAAAVDIFFQGNGSARSKMIQNVHKIGVVYGRFTLDHGIIMVQNKTGIFQHKFTIQSVQRRSKGRTRP